MTNIPAMSYGRVSSQEQAKGWSPETQLEACREYAAGHGMALVGEYSDVETGATVERDGFQQMMRDIRAGKASTVIVFQTDRLHRDLAHAMLTRKELQRLGVELHTVKRGKSGTTPEEQFADNIDDLLAELERARIMERTNRGKHAKMKSGQVLGAGPAPYGYEYVGSRRDRHLVIDEKTAPVVRLIFQWYAYGDGDQGPMSVNLIAIRLTEMGVPSPADVAGREKWHKERPVGTWARSHVYPLLNQTAYSGTYTLYRRKWIDKTHSVPHKPESQFHVPVPAIVDLETWEAAQRRLESGKGMSRGHQVHEYLLGRRIRCACGYRVHGRASSKSGHRDELRLWYLCNGRVRRLTAHPCSVHLPWLRAEPIDAAVWEYLRNLLQDEALLEERITLRQQQERAKDSTAQVSRDELLARRAKLERANTRITDLYESEEIDRQEWRRRKAVNDALIAELDQRLAAIELPAQPELPPLSARMADAVRMLAADVRVRLDGLPFEARRKIIDALDVQVLLRVEGDQRLARVESILGIDELPLP